MTNGNTISARSTVPQNLEDLISAVGEDPDLQPIEKETVIRWGKIDDEAWIYSEEGSIIRRLLCHPLFEVTELRTHDGTAGWREGATACQQGQISGIKGYLPIGAVKVQSSSRSDSAHCKVVSKEGLVSP